MDQKVHTMGSERPEVFFWGGRPMLAEKDKRKKKKPSIFWGNGLYVIRSKGCNSFSPLNFWCPKATLYILGMLKRR